MATKKCECKRCAQALWSSWQNRSTTKHWSKVCGRLWKAKPQVELGISVAQGGLLWQLLQDSDPPTKTLFRAHSSRSYVAVPLWSRYSNKSSASPLRITPFLFREKQAPGRN